MGRRSKTRTAAAPAVAPVVAPRTWVGILLVAAAVFVIFRIVCASVPLERDEGEYAYIAQRILHGELPYRDIFDQKPPAIFLAYLIPVAIFGRSVVAIHVVMYAATALAGLFVYRIASALRGPRTAALAVVAFAAMTIDPAWETLASNTEQFMLLPLTASVWFTMRALATGRARHWLVVGATTAAAAAFKQVALVNVAFIGGMVIAAAIRRPREVLPALRLGVPAALGGVALVVVPLAAWFILPGAGAAAWDCIWTNNVNYAAKVPFNVGMHQLWLMLGEQAPAFSLVWALAGVGIVGSLVRGGKAGDALFHAGWLATSAIGVSVGLYFRPHYFIQLAPALAIAAGAGLDWIASIVEGRRRAPLGQAAGAAMALLLAAPFVIVSWGFWMASANDKCRAMYHDNPFIESVDIAQYLADNTKPEDTVLVFGSEPELLFLAERRSATRYIIFYPLMMNLGDSLQRQREALAEIRRANPRVIIITNIYGSLLQQPGSPTEIYQAVDPSVLAGYRLEGVRTMTSFGLSMMLGPDAADVAQRLAQAGPKKPEMLVFVRR